MFFELKFVHGLKNVPDIQKSVLGPKNVQVSKNIVLGFKKKFKKFKICSGIKHVQGIQKLFPEFQNCSWIQKIVQSIKKLFSEIENLIFDSKKCSRNSKFVPGSKNVQGIQKLLLEFQNSSWIQQKFKACKNCSWIQKNSRHSKLLLD